MKIRSFQGALISRRASARPPAERTSAKGRPPSWRNCWRRVSTCRRRRPCEVASHRSGSGLAKGVRHPSEPEPRYRPIPISRRTACGNLSAIRVVDRNALVRAERGHTSALLRPEDGKVSRLPRGLAVPADAGPLRSPTIPRPASHGVITGTPARRRCHAANGPVFETGPRQRTYASEQRRYAFSRSPRGSRISPFRTPATRKGPLFRTAPRRKGELTRNPMGTADVWRMIQRRAKKAGIRTADLLPQLPGDRDHELPGERRDAGEGPADGRPRVAEDDQALRPDQRRRSRSTRSSGSRYESRRPLQGNHGRVTRSNEDQAGATLPEHHERAARRPRPCCATAVAPLLKGFNRSQAGPSRPA